MRWFALLVVVACYPGVSNDDGNSTDIVATTHKEVDFHAYRTFMMPDKVAHLTNVEGGTDNLTHQYDNLMLDEVRNNMLALGYALEPNPATVKSDLAVVVGISSEDNWYYYQPYYWWGYWGYYPGWTPYPPLAGWGMYYPGIPVVVNYKIGTVVVEIWDMKNLDTTAQKVQVLWVGIVQGVLYNNGGSASTGPRISQGINKAFAQSPYLKIAL